MPYREVWYPAPTNESLPVLSELPTGYEEDRWRMGARQATARFGLDGHPHFEAKPRAYHYCHRCGGWVPGEPYTSEVSNLGPLSGRKGTEYYCRRCGKEIGFVGMVS
jgi:hypothetical protein